MIDKRFEYYNVVSEFEHKTSSVIRLQKYYLEYRLKNSSALISFGAKIALLTKIAIFEEIATSESEAAYLAWSAVGLGEIFLLLKDLNITDVSASHLDGPLIITHWIRGRCITNLNFSKRFWKALKIQSELNSNKILTFLNPSLKTGLMTELGNIRIVLQIPPLAVNSPVMTIRRLPQVPISIESLIQTRQISSTYATLLLEAINERKNIIIVGEPGSGKTTLANALLMQTNPNWRTFILEDAKELTFPHELFPNLIRYNIPSIGEAGYKEKRINEITKILHRSPDYVFFGEIQNANDTRAIFEGFSAGIRGISTIHAGSFDALFARWEGNHQISRNLIHTVHLIVLTKRSFDGNKFYIKVEAIMQLENSERRLVRDLEIN